MEASAMGLPVERAEAAVGAGKEPCTQVASVTSCRRPWGLLGCIGYEWSFSNLSY